MIPESQYKRTPQENGELHENFFMNSYITYIK